MSTIIHRLYLRETLKVFILVLSCLFLLFVLIDYSSRTYGMGLTPMQYAHYYGLLFVSRIDVLAPFALLLAGIKTLCQANLRNELVAMRASGTSLPHSLRPLIWLGLACTALVYANNEFLLPQSLHVLHSVEDHSGSTTRKPIKSTRVHAIALADGSRLLYGSYDRTDSRLHACHWIRSFDDIYRIASLEPWSEPARGHNVQHLTRDEQGLLVPGTWKEEQAMSDLVIDPQELTEYVTLPIERSLSQLWQRMPQSSITLLTYEQVQVEAAFWKKLVLPWLCLIALLAPAPFCVAFRRPLHVFFIFAGGIFGLFGFYIAISAAYTLAQNQVLTPAIALGLPSLIAILLSVYRFQKMR